MEVALGRSHPRERSAGFGGARSRPAVHVERPGSRSVEPEHARNEQKKKKKRVKSTVSGRKETIGKSTNARRATTDNNSLSSVDITRWRRRQ